MRAPRILLFARDPGGAAMLPPLVKPLQQSGYTVALYGKETALDKYRGAGLTGHDICPELTSFDLAGMSEFIRQEQPDFIITGTSSNDMAEKLLWQAAALQQIPTLALVDQWINYGIRFSEHGLQQIDAYRANPQHGYLPEWIGVIDDFAKAEAIAEGLPVDRLVVTGHPGFRDLKQEFEQLDPWAIQQRLGIKPNEQVITFVSEPLSASYSGADYLGYTEKTVFQAIVASLQALDGQFPAPIVLLIKLHPKEEPRSYESMLAGLKLQQVRFLVVQNVASLDVLAVSDLVLGMYSMLLIEAAICGKPIASVQIGLKRDNPFMLCRQGITTPILDPKALSALFQSVCIDDKLPLVDFSWDNNAVSRILEFLKPQLERKPSRYA